MNTTKRFRAFGLSLFLATAGCAGTQIPKDAQSTVVSIRGLDCADCGEELATRLGKTEGVYKASFDKVRSEVTVVAAPSFDALSSAKTLSGGEEYELVGGAGNGSYLPWSEPPEGADVKTIGKPGEDVPDLTPHLASGKLTVVDFSAAWCEPCRKLDEHMVTVLKQRSDIAYRKLDIGDWDSPLAARYMRNVKSLPYVIVFDKSGQKSGEVVGLDLAKLDLALGKAPQ